MRLHEQNLTLNEIAEKLGLSTYSKKHQSCNQIDAFSFVEKNGLIGGKKIFLIFFDFIFLKVLFILYEDDKGFIK